MKSKLHGISSLLFFLLFWGISSFAQNKVSTKSGRVVFASNAALEKIEATSNALNGAIDLPNNTFAFSVEVKTFAGFNSALQQEHFFENYMETDKYPKSTFSGKLIDPLKSDLSQQKVRAKGALTVHGVTKERIIEVSITKKGSSYDFKSNFNISLEDHNIVIPKVVAQKISESIAVSIEGNMSQ
ncbi:MAG: YceI family protein [Flavobacteriales bacterium]